MNTSTNGANIRENMSVNENNEPLVRLLTPQEKRAMIHEGIRQVENDMRLEQRRHDVTVSRLNRRREQLEESLRKVHD